MSEANFRREMISKKDFNQTEEKFGTQSSNAKSERQREFDNNNNQRSEPGGSCACLASPWQRPMRLRVLRLDNWWIEVVTERNVMTVFWCW